ncbi:copper homeostasis protein CutC [Caproiciproducens faecalis]|uniref:PF03932 family protein CutC n=1 Tax=Caproiciproducens faecalis TaxID=2820301 RepID=A0ABS7DKE9_9FIRM|nr:copper homeostasis protein CutC [Caproiciproducens faecalis]MBW7571310.1 copper homeostasis protein CutC [Caproiciproducens faecalis]
MKDYILEGCVDSVESAVAAEKGGANRLELCGNLIIGGTTPDINLFLAVREKVSIKINVLIRPRFGDFCYTDEEFNIIKKDVEMFREHGADGVVIGVLQPDGNLDLPKMKELMAAAGDMSVTLHRAFDVSRDPFQTLQDAKDLHISTILTSGQKNTCYEGRELLAQLVEKAAGEIDILVGSGVNSAQLEEMAAVTKAKSFHLSGKKNLESAMTYRKEDVSMGLPLMSEFIIYRTDAGEIAKARDILQRL